MSKIIVTSIVYLYSLIGFSQVSENRTVGEFSKLKASQGIEVLYTVATTVSVKVETDDNEKLKFIKTEVENGTLNVFIDTNAADATTEKKKKKKYNNGVNFRTVKAYISGPSLQAIKASSSASIVLENANTTLQLEIAASSSGSISGSFDCDDLKIDVSSSGDFKGKVTAKSIQIEASSSGDVALTGKANQVLVKASSSADCDLKGLVAEEAKVKASSSADVTVYASLALEADASSSADIVFYGNPSQVRTDKSSSGSVTKR